MPDDTTIFGLPKPDPEERKAAVAEPGPSWRTWFYSSFAKVYLGLALFILDALDASSWLGPPVTALHAGALLGTLLALLYAEYVLVQYLWHRPGPSEPLRAVGWARAVHPFPFGRWTEEGERYRRGERLPPPPGPNPDEFL